MKLEDVLVVTREDLEEKAVNKNFEEIKSSDFNKLTKENMRMASCVMFRDRRKMTILKDRNATFIFGNYKHPKM